MSSLLYRAGFSPLDGRLVSGSTAVLLSEGWRVDREDPAEREMDAILSGFRPIWLVDGRDMALAFGANAPDMVCPSWLLGAAWSPFVQTWLRPRSVPVVIHLRNAAPGYPDNPTDAVYFVVEDGIPYTVRRKRGALNGVDATGANGRATTLRDFVLVARRLPELEDHQVTRRYFDGRQHVTRQVAAPFATAWKHTLDLSPWVRNDDGVTVPRDITFAGHQQRMAARRNTRRQQHEDPRGGPG